MRTIQFYQIILMSMRIILVYQVIRRWSLLPSNPLLPPSSGEKNLRFERFQAGPGLYISCFGSLQQVYSNAQFSFKTNKYDNKYHRENITIADRRGGEGQPLWFLPSLVSSVYFYCCIFVPSLHIQMLYSLQFVHPDAPYFIFYLILEYLYIIRMLTLISMTGPE